MQALLGLGKPKRVKRRAKCGRVVSSEHIGHLEPPQERRKGTPPPSPDPLQRQQRKRSRVLTVCSHSRSRRGLGAAGMRANPSLLSFPPLHMAAADPAAVAVGLAVKEMKTKMYADPRSVGRRARRYKIQHPATPAPCGVRRRRNRRVPLRHRREALCGITAPAVPPPPPRAPLLRQAVHHARASPPLCSCSTLFRRRRRCSSKCARRQRARTERR